MRDITYGMLITNASRNWRLGIFWDLHNWAFGVQVVCHLSDKWSHHRIEFHIFVGPIDLQYIAQRDKRIT